MQPFRASAPLEEPSFIQTCHSLKIQVLDFTHANKDPSIPNFSIFGTHFVSFITIKKKNKNKKNKKKNKKKQQQKKNKQTKKQTKKTTKKKKKHTKTTKKKQQKTDTHNT